MRQPYMSTHPRGLQTGMKFGFGAEIESAPRNFTPEGPWGWRRLQRQNILSSAMDRYVLVVVSSILETPKKCNFAMFMHIRCIIKAL